MHFKQQVYHNQLGTVSGDLMAAYRFDVPSMPVEHGEGAIGISSEWWYLSGMYKPSKQCSRCTMDPAYAAALDVVSKGRAVDVEGYYRSQQLRHRTAKHLLAASQAKRKSRTIVGSTSVPSHSKTSQLYSIPRVFAPGTRMLALECCTWPRYDRGEFTHDRKANGPSMLELTDEEYRALQIVVLRTEVKAQRWEGARHFLNWKKVGVSRAYYKPDLVREDKMPTARAAAAFRYLKANNWYYLSFLGQQEHLILHNRSLNLSSYSLFIIERGIECAMFPHLYPQTQFTDTAVWNHYQATVERDEVRNRLCSIGYSWTRKALSSVRVYAEQRDLAFFLYEVDLANRYFNAHARAKRLTVTADVMARDSHTSRGYWEITQDALADVVRVMLARCYDQENYPQLYNHVRGLRGQVWLCAFPNLFITIAPAEWKFPRPYFLELYLRCVFAGAYLMSLHMYYLVRMVWLFLARRFGNRYFVVYEWVMKTEYQGRCTPHWHIAAWVIACGLLQALSGRTGTAVVSLFVALLEAIFNCEIDVQIGNGRLNYINGYVSKVR